MDERFCFCPLITFCCIDFHLLRYYGQNMENMPKLPGIKSGGQGSSSLVSSWPFAAFSHRNSHPRRNTDTANDKICKKKLLRDGRNRGKFLLFRQGSTPFCLLPIIRAGIKPAPLVTPVFLLLVIFACHAEL